MLAQVYFSLSLSGSVLFSLVVLHGDVTVVVVVVVVVVLSFFFFCK